VSEIIGPDESGVYSLI